MIDAFFVFNKTGLILWSYRSEDAEPLEILEQVLRGLVENIFLEERLTQKYYDHGAYRVNWSTINEYQIVLAIVYQNAYSTVSTGSYFETLLSMARKKVVKIILENPDSVEDDTYFEDFRSQFVQMIDFCDSRLMNKGGNKSDLSPLNSSDEKSFGSKNRSYEGKPTDSEDNISQTSKFKKTSRQWNSQKVTKKNMEQLDYSKKCGNSEDSQSKLSFYERSEDEVSEDELEEINQEKKAVSYWSSFLSSQFGILNSNTTLTAEMVEKPLQKLKSQLVEKNVASEIAQDIIDSVSNAMVGVKTQGSFSKLDTILLNSLRDAITKILSPKKPIDVLSDALKAKQHSKVYSIAFLGVNGVGKSTNLAKVCYLLKNKGNLNVLIVACDTFRAGAIEQLKTHANCLGVQLYEKGYGKDAAMVAKDAISYARDNGFDVVLIDTAGRMQDNVPLMKSLAKLVQVNNPDLVLFVGEALVGNDAVHQLQVFNKYLVEFGDRPIDGIILTKFDTVDDKVGAALSMVYSTGQPVVFIGTGQKYYNLKTLSVPSVVNALLKS
ncbi:SRP101p signal recognition particle receptor alpha subunit [Cryptosporidium ubiquitum]|uniref:SRP101p signal recognition particle receptor alpha subunit n=1 Tax=Cryptosporidium ubiquitum TaxID=857276 RepID=A0A1J4MLZ9_9CRYT|nr:SRP101p signal recognition particle receptor alpha subunit [Cryptosporidium ubiquitum]OII75273.1 SRP101p signal recognition particle receptor alpha subunit [Cryptosporidium ubiquitum]